MKKGKSTASGAAGITNEILNCLPGLERRPLLDLLNISLFGKTAKRVEGSGYSSDTKKQRRTRSSVRNIMHVQDGDETINN